MQLLDVQVYINIYIYALYILHICTCTYIIDVSKRGVLGSADDKIAFFLHNLSILVVIYFFADHEHFLWTNTCIFYFITRYCIFSSYHDIVYCSLFFFAIYMQYHLHGRHGTVENASNILEF